MYIILFFYFCVFLVVVHSNLRSSTCDTKATFFYKIKNHLWKWCNFNLLQIILSQDILLLSVLLLIIVIITLFLKWILLCLRVCSYYKYTFFINISILKIFVHYFHESFLILLFFLRIKGLSIANILFWRARMTKTVPFIFLSLVLVNLNLVTHSNYS